MAGRNAWRMLARMDETAFRSGCRVCGAALAYLPREIDQTCAYCRAVHVSAMRCAAGEHFVCDACHGAGALEVIERTCRAAPETDMTALLRRVRSHPAIPLHGPEHHALVPGIVLACCRNAGLDLDDARLAEAIRRGGRHPGGACGYLGACGAAVGLGAAFSVALGATPTEGPLRGDVILVVADALARIGAQGAARCCQRDVWLALQVAAEAAPRLLGVHPTAGGAFDCEQFPANAECALEACPLHPLRG